MAARRDGGLTANAAQRIVEPTPTAAGRAAAAADRPATWRLTVFLGGTFLTSCGVWLQNVVAAVLVYSITGSSFDVGAVTALQFAPTLLLAPVAGSLVDRFDPRRLMLVGVVCTAGGSLGTWLVLLVNDGQLATPTAVFVGSGLVGIGFALSAPTMQALLPSMVVPDALDRVVALQVVGFNISRVVGPVVASAVLLWGGPTLGFAVSGATHVTMAAALIAIGLRYRRPDRGPVADDEAWTYRRVLAVPAIRVALVGLVALGVAMDPVITLGPGLVERHGLDTDAAGLLVTAFGIGAVLGWPVLVVALRRWSHRTVGVVGVATLAVCMAAVAASPTIEVTLTLVGAAGVGLLVGTSSLTSLLHAEADRGGRGRIMALWTVAFMGSRPLAALVVGGVADAVSVPAGLIAAGVAGLAGAAVVAGGRDAPPPPDPTPTPPEHPTDLTCSTPRT